MKHLLFSALILLPLACKKKKIKPEMGGIDIISNVYIDASHTLDKVQSFHISQINYKHDTIVELVPNPTVPGLIDEVNIIFDTICYQTPNPLSARSTDFSQIKKQVSGLSMRNKKNGIIYHNEEVPGYDRKTQLSDTVLFGKKYKRFETNTKDFYTRYYIFETDTVLPYSINPIIDKDFKGRLERVDSYNKQRDIFVTLQMIPRNKWDDEAAEIFKYNDYLKNGPKHKRPN